MRFSAFRNGSTAPIENSARFANSLAKSGAQYRISVVEVDGATAYHVRTVHDLLWLSANVVAPAGYKPMVMLSSVQRSRSTLVSSEPLGVSHSETGSEYMYLRLGVGDWLVEHHDSDGVTLTKMSHTDLLGTLADTGIGELELKENSVERLVS